MRKIRDAGQVIVHGDCVDCDKRAHQQLQRWHRARPIWRREGCVSSSQFIDVRHRRVGYLRHHLAQSVYAIRGKSNALMGSERGRTARTGSTLRNYCSGEWREYLPTKVHIEVAAVFRRDQKLRACERFPRSS